MGDGLRPSGHALGRTAGHDRDPCSGELQDRPRRKRLAYRHRSRARGRPLRIDAALRDRRGGLTALTAELPVSPYPRDVVSLSLELIIDAPLTEVARGRKLLRLIKRYAPEALAAESAVIRLDPGELESYVTIDVDPRQVPAERLVAFAEAACARYPVAYGHVHLMTEADRRRFGP